MAFVGQREGKGGRGGGGGEMDEVVLDGKG